MEQMRLKKMLAKYLKEWPENCDIMGVDSDGEIRAKKTGKVEDSVKSGRPREFFNEPKLTEVEVSFEDRCEHCVFQRQKGAPFITKEQWEKAVKKRRDSGKKVAYKGRTVMGCIDEHNATQVKERLLKLLAKHAVWVDGAKTCEQSIEDQEVYWYDKEGERMIDAAYHLRYIEGVYKVSNHVYVEISKKEFRKEVEKRIAKGKSVKQDLEKL